MEDQTGIGVTVNGPITEDNGALFNCLLGCRVEIFSGCACCLVVMHLDLNCPESAHFYSIKHI